jgi:hypothetical protein
MIDRRAIDDPASDQGAELDALELELMSELHRRMPIGESFQLANGARCTVAGLYGPRLGEDGELEFAFDVHIEGDEATGLPESIGFTLRSEGRGGWKLLDPLDAEDE